MIRNLSEKQEKCIIQCNIATDDVVEPCGDADAARGYCDRTYQNCVEVCLLDESEEPGEHGNP